MGRSQSARATQASSSIPRPSVPTQDRCEGNFDAIANIRGETFFFKGADLRRPLALPSSSPPNWVTLLGSGGFLGEVGTWVPKGGLSSKSQRSRDPPIHKGVSKRIWSWRVTPASPTSCPLPPGPWFWRLQPSGQLVSPRPAGLHRFWEGLPAEVKMVQAAYARPSDGRILLFSGEWGPGRAGGWARVCRAEPGGRDGGKWTVRLGPDAASGSLGPQFWVFRDRQLDGSPRPLTELGLPPGEVVDAVFSWPSNGKTYLIRGQRYWRFDEAAGRADPGYPRDLSLWEGAPPAPDDVTVSNTGRAEAGGRRARGSGRWAH